MTLIYEGAFVIKIPFVIRLNKALKATITSTLIKKNGKKKWYTKFVKSFACIFLFDQGNYGDSREIIEKLKELRNYN